jgi:superfamily II DNA/RNA helicase
MSFSELGLTPPLLAAIRQAGFDKPTPVQEKAIPAALKGTDLMVSAQTGSGKTAAFMLPALNKLHKSMVCVSQLLSAACLMAPNSKHCHAGWTCWWPHLVDSSIT